MPRPFFPILHDYSKPGMLRGIPWGMVAHLEERAQKNHGQTLERLAERSGLDPSEMYKLLNDENLFPEDKSKMFEKVPDAEQKIMVMILEFLEGA